MKITLHRAADRGYYDYGWLKTYYSFSFGEYYNPNRMGFGALCVINDDIIAGGHGFDLHPHRNMEIVTIPLEGKLEHRDSMGNREVITPENIQIMSAGTGIRHSEKNPDPNQAVKLLQIWVRPDKTGVVPRYNMLPIKRRETYNTLTEIIAPDKQSGGAYLHQNARFNLGCFQPGHSVNYQISGEGQVLYTFVISGSYQTGDTLLKERDAAVLKIPNTCRSNRVKNMGDLIKSLQWRYATKKFDPSKKLSETQLNELMQATALSASSFGLQPYHILVITNPETRQKLRPVSWGQAQITDASHLFVFCNMVKPTEKTADVFIDNVSKTRGVPKETLADYAGMIKGFIKNMDDNSLKGWTARQAYLAAGNLMLAAAHAEIDTCPMEGFSAADYNQILGLDDKGLNAAVLVAVGFRAADDPYIKSVKVRKPLTDLFTHLK
ncbi:hypothetical protein CHS0354_001977 [Potamilus streckersoni]|uniref:Pirin family protein n=1 Tax=Potamilus streckersoni TaxID=2493646 RepID=A0AAE0W8J0_9BIVA|nr:hypothetical protein CHS0354_001977 [Potamilus streckersoni]